MSEIYPLFSKPVYVNKLSFNGKKFLPIIEDEFVESGGEKRLNQDRVSRASVDKDVLSRPQFKDLKNLLIKESKKYYKDILKYSNDFKITTSWFTKTLKDESSNYHKHSNALISGVLYLKVPKNSGDINFQVYNDETFHLDCTEYNIYNSTNYTFETFPNLLIMFPSNLYHKILKSESNEPRISLAFNMMPYGDISNKNTDSYFFIK